ncbi:MAG: LysM peptidoglycan-binding domain-containing protein [Sandaracinaceae bacterium]|nr:LysM peptidoglycan-binding domain-containing protein [Sandaracinaceae bacterium]
MQAVRKIARALRLHASACVGLAALLAAAWPGCDEPAPRAADAGARRAEAPPPEPPPEEAPEEPEAPPPGVDHTVGEGETLWQIARAYGVTVAAITAANRLRPRDVGRLRPGRTLRIPGATEVLTTTAPSAEPAELPPVADGAYHRLGSGETLWDVARLYEVSIDDLMTRNELDDEAVRLLRPGRALVVPGATERQVERVTRARATTGRSRPGRRAASATPWRAARPSGISRAPSA